LEPGKVRNGKVNEVFVYDNFSRVPVEEVQAGDICAITGIQDIGVRHDMLFFMSFFMSFFVVEEDMVHDGSCNFSRGTFFYQCFLACLSVMCCGSTDVVAVSQVAFCQLKKVCGRGSIIAPAAAAAAAVAAR
jgi:hypothetical protein